MYPWLVFLHVASALGFMMAHGVSAAVAFALRGERSPERVRVLLELSAGSYRLMYPALILIVVSGVGLAFLGGYWDRGWIWASLGGLVLIAVAMSALGGRYYSEARKAAGLPYYERGRPCPALPARSPEVVQAALAQANPVLLTAIGLGGWLIITWLMIFKPF